MEQQFWVASWDREGTATSFHRNDIHPYVQTYAGPELIRGKRVLVPLCGKTNDMLWFAEHADHVVGIELVEKAIVQFFTEHAIPYAKTADGRYESERITLLHRDIFDVQPADVGRIDFVYDRAALVALPLEMRLEYVKKINDLVPIGASQLIVTLEYAPLMDTPPFSIAPTEMTMYYGGDYRVDHVAHPERPEHRMIPKFGLSFLKEHAFVVTKIGDRRS